MASTSYRGHLSTHSVVTDVGQGACGQQVKRGSLEPVIFIDLPDGSDDRPVEMENRPAAENRPTAENRPMVHHNQPTSRRTKEEPLPQIFVTLSENEEDRQASTSYVRADSAEDGLSLSPLPLDYPDPPPSYREVIDLDRHQDPPRTTVITIPAPPTKDKHRKHLTCQHCLQQVHTVVCRQIGPVTHLTAIICLLFCVFPLTILVYCIDTFKSRVHYCPACSKVIGREEPIICRDIVYESR